jgi:hypothetical protein
MTEEAQRAASLAADTVKRILPLLHGLDPETTSAVLAQLVSMWVAGHVILEADGPNIERAETEAARQEVFAYWTSLVHRLVPISEAELLRDSGCQSTIVGASAV